MIVKILILSLSSLFACSPINQNSKQKEFTVKEPQEPLIGQDMEMTSVLFIKRDGKQDPDLHKTNKSIKFGVYRVTTSQIKETIWDTELVLSQKNEVSDTDLPKAEYQTLIKEIYDNNIASESAKNWQYLFESKNSSESPLQLSKAEFAFYLAEKGFFPPLSPDGAVTRELANVAEHFSEIFPTMPKNWEEFVKSIKIATINEHIKIEQQNEIIKSDSDVKKILGYELDKAVFLERTEDGKPCTIDTTNCTKVVEKLFSFDKVINKETSTKQVDSKRERVGERSLNIIVLNSAQLFEFEEQSIQISLTYTDKNQVVVDEVKDLTGTYQYESPVVTKLAGGHFKIELKPSYRNTIDLDFSVMAAITNNSQELVLSFRDEEYVRPNLAGRASVDYALIYKGKNKVNAVFSKDRIILPWNNDLTDMGLSRAITVKIPTEQVRKVIGSTTSDINGFYSLKWVENRSDLQFEYYSSETPSRNKKGEYIYQEVCFFIKSGILEMVGC